MNFNQDIDRFVNSLNQVIDGLVKILLKIYLDDFLLWYMDLDDANIEELAKI